MSEFSEACRLPFSNGTERSAWEHVWCAHCVHDHDISHASAVQANRGCDLLSILDCGGPATAQEWPEAWLPEPKGSFSLPSRMICGQFQPCTTGDCDGDPQAETRAAIAAEVTEFWQSRVAAGDCVTDDR